MFHNHVSLVVIICIHSGEPTTNQIQLHQIHVPHHPQVNQSVSLWCEYDLHGEPLYSIKWYKDQQEFYRFLPKESPPQLSFPVEGTVVELGMSDMSVVHLTNISLASAGQYQCEVSTEAPKFKTIAQDSAMSVVHPPAESPAITWANKRDRLRNRLGELWGIRVGERLLIHCESEESFPAASLKFYI